MEGMHNTQNLGAYGERCAAQFLLRHGFEIIARNFRVRGAEIDIIARQHGTLYFVEVKTRAGVSHGAPESAIHFYKQRHIEFAARIFIASHQEYADCEIHFSSIAIQVDRINASAHIRFVKDIL